MNEIYDERNKEKKVINQKSNDALNFFVNEREIWYVKLGLNIGFEENGKLEFRRPVLVIKRVGCVFFVVPMTTKGKNNKFYYKLKFHSFAKDSFLLLSQAKIIDKKRFMHLIGTISEVEENHIKKSLVELLL